MYIFDILVFHNVHLEIHKKTIWQIQYKVRAEQDWGEIKCSYLFLSNSEAKCFSQQDLLFSFKMKPCVRLTLVWKNDKCKGQTPFQRLKNKSTFMCTQRQPLCAGTNHVERFHANRPGKPRLKFPVILKIDCRRSGLWPLCKS